MTESRPGKHYDDPNPSPTLVAGVIGAILVFLIIVALQAIYYRAQDAENRRKIVAEAPPELTSLRAQHQEQLEGYRWIDEKKEIVAIPIDRAMSIEASALNAARATADSTGGRR